MDKADPRSLLSFVQKLELLVTTEREKGRVVPCISLETQQVVEFFSVTNQYIDFRGLREYDIPEIKLNLLQPFTCTGLKPSARELLQSICTVWPKWSKSNIRVFVSLLIHFSVEQINSDVELISSDRLNVPSSSSEVAPVSAPEKAQSSLKSTFPVTLKVYTEALAFWETKDGLYRKFICPRIYRLQHFIRPKKRPSPWENSPR